MVSGGLQAGYGGNGRRPVAGLLVMGNSHDASHPIHRSVDELDADPQEGGCF